MGQDEWGFVVTIITPNWIFLRVTKTGSETVQTLLRSMCEEGYLPYDAEEIRFKTTDKGLQKERFSDLDANEQSRFIFGSIRNPWRWYPSFYEWYHTPRMQEYTKTDHRVIPMCVSFEDWVKENPEKMVEEARLHYPENPRLIRIENFAEELIVIFEEAGQPISEAGIDYIRRYPAQNANKDRKKRYEDYYTAPLKELVLQGADPIFDTYYSDRSFPEEK